jgi:hypothetical protein
MSTRSRSRGKRCLVLASANGKNKIDFGGEPVITNGVDDA